MYGPKGKYGEWIRKRPALAQIGGVIFLHGGIDPSVSSIAIEDINKRVRSEFAKFDDAYKSLVDQNILLPFFTLQEATAVVQAELSAERKSLVPVNPFIQAKIAQFMDYGNWLCVREDGPLWLRAYDRWTEEAGTPQVEKILKGYAATNIVVGHTVQRGGQIRARFGGKVMLIDTGMLSSYYTGGKASALKIDEDGTITAVYLDQQTVLVEGKSAQTGMKKDPQ
jgi:hypothetical protein